MKKIIMRDQKHANSHIGTKYPCAITREDAERLDNKRIGRVFLTACFIAYLVCFAIVIAAIS